MKFAFPLALCLALLTAGCNTIENRRGEYAPKKADGPYTRALREGTWNEQKSVDVQYQESKRQRATQSRQPASAPAREEATPAPPL